MAPAPLYYCCVKERGQRKAVIASEAKQSSGDGRDLNLLRRRQRELEGG